MLGNKQKRKEKMIDIEDLFGNQSLSQEHAGAESQNKAPGINSTVAPIDSLDPQGLMEVMRKHTHHNGVSLECLNRAVKLARIPMHTQAFLRRSDPTQEDDAFRLVLHMMQLHAHDPRISMIGTCFLGTLLRQILVPGFSDSDGALDMIMKESGFILGLIDTIIQLQEAHQSSVGTAAYACYTLQSALQVLFSSSATDPSLLESLIEPTLLNFTVNVLKRHTKDQFCVQNVFDLILEILATSSSHQVSLSPSLIESWASLMNDEVLLDDIFGFDSDALVLLADRIVHHLGALSLS